MNEESPVIRPKKSRWEYMSRPGFAEKDNSCPECTEPSIVYFIGAKTVDGVSQQRFECENHHSWVVKEENNSIFPQLDGEET